MIKLVALDMDGTLLNSQGEISKETEKELKRILKLGIHVVLASGRPSFSLKRFFNQLNINNNNEYSIAFNGCQIINNGSLKEIYRKTISAKDVKRAYNLSTQISTSFFAYADDESILFQNNSEYVLFEKNLVNHPCVKQINFNNIPDEKQFIKMTFTENAKKLNEISDIVNQEFSSEYNVVRSHSYFIEVINKETSKGKALNFLCEYLNISPKEVMSFGDNDNDYELLKASKYRIVMSNSKSELLRNIATEICPSNDEDGIAYTLKKYIK